MDTLDLLLHPVRLRLVYALSGDRVRTTAELCESVPDVPKASVYRHVAHLIEGGVVEVADEHRVRGAVERYYRLRRDRPRLSADSGKSMTLDDHRQGFAAGMAAVHAEFNAYLDRPGADPYADRVGYRQGIFWLTDEEFSALTTQLQTVIAPLAQHEPGPGRHPRLISLVQFPTAEPPAEPAGE
ncbi:MAG: helix-turn-helix domain-containing protein [Hamadaea sp.]|uniref:helix-turn-helix domain-containing protein n=1 Tax=Hamadaea sp. TaxID=2024425 RepID=UPI0017D4D910|nr:helix-turn-helix domain-containing protein [Hamadaea sp.]NUR69682.1 helix-turn-helix domain-containing protein [Hamadaea sp.]NUT19549.1 helix-turn-helix domain-containing protein [Hamadaea sp.]